MFEEHPEYSRTEKVRIDVLRCFGYYSTESNGHLTEYLPWYRKRPQEITQWIDLSSWIYGETGGYLRASTASRDWFETEFPAWQREEPAQWTAELRSNKHASYIIEALVTGSKYRGQFNVMNQRHITNLSDGALSKFQAMLMRTASTCWL
jgi:alpha-galactosidase